MSALFGAAERQEQLDRVEDELFRFGRITESDADLQLALSSPALSTATKTGILADLLSGRVSPATLDVLSFVTSHLRGRRLDQAVDQMVDLAAQRRGRLVATVRVISRSKVTRSSASPLRSNGSTSKPMSVNVEIVPALVGGITVQVGDEVFDGSISARIDNARRRVTG